MTQTDWLAKRFEENHERLRAVAYRILGSRAEADDALQETWLRLAQSDADSIANPGGWLTTVVARVCLDMLRTRKTRNEAPLQEAPKIQSEASPENDVLLAESIAPGLLVILETLTPAERVAFVLHDVFDLSFEEIAPIIGRSEVASRQLARRARRRVRGGDTAGADETRKQEIVAAFLKATREGDLAGLLQLLDPEVCVRADEVAIKTAEANRDKGAPQFKSKIQGAKTIAELFNRKALGARLALINGSAGSTWIAGGKPRVVFAFTVAEGRISGIDVIMNAGDLDELEVTPIEEE